MRLYLQNFSYLSCLWPFCSKLGTNLLLRHSPLFNVRYANYMNINGNFRIKRRIIEKIKGYTYKTTSSVAAYCPRSI